AVIADMARTASVIATAWRDRYADTLATAGEADNDVYLSADEGRRDLFTALSTGLQTTAELRLGRPLGSFERPRPKRAEARRSGRSLRHVALSLEASRALAAILAAGAPEELRGAVDAPFARALDSAADLDDPVFAGVADPVGRIRIEALQLRVNETRRAVALSLGPHLGIAAGFNSLDGD
ncbi:MAG: imelysin family protein, partial [Pseudomonadota bacterium]